MDNNSLNFVKNRIDSGETSLFISDYESIVQVNLLNWLRDNNNEDVANYISDGIRATKGDFNYTIKYDPNCEYDYFTMSRCNCDGTLIFYNELCSKTLNKVVNAETCKGDSVTDDIYDNIKDYIVDYTIGDFVFGDEYDLKKFETKEKPWMHSRFTVMLPIKFDVKLKL